MTAGGRSGIRSPPSSCLELLLKQASRGVSGVVASASERSRTLAVVASGPSTRTIVRVVLTTAATVLALYLAYLIRGVFQLVVLALFLSLFLGPSVGFLVRHRVPRWLSILLVYVGLFASIFLLGQIAVPPIAREINSGVHQLPAGIAKLRRDPTFRKYDNKYGITQKLNAEARKLPSRLASAARTLSSLTVGAFSAVAKLITVLALAFFLLRDGSVLAARAYRIRGPDHEDRLRAIGDDIYRSVAGYVAGNVAISIVAGAVAYTVLRVLGVAFAGPLAVLVGVLDLLPLVGATIAAIIVGIVTLFFDFPVDTIVWAITAIVYQQVENNLLSPVVYRRTVKVPGMLVIIAVLIGSVLGGVIGALLAIPTAAAIQIVVRDVWSRRGSVTDVTAPAP